MRSGRLEQLSPVVLSRARQRLAVLALLFGLVFNAVTLASFGWFRWGGTNWLAYTHDIDLITANLWLLLALVARIPALSDVQVLRTGQAVMVLSCFSLAFLHGFNHVPAGEPVPVLTWAPLLIATYPLLVPSSPRMTLGVVALATLATPAGVGLGALSQGVVSGPDMVASVVAPAVAAVLAGVGSELLHGSTVDVQELEQQEALLQAVLGGVDASIVVRGPGGQTVYSNRALPEHVLDAPGGLLVDPMAARPETWMVSHNAVVLGGTPHRLTVARPITDALDAAEVESWKQLIRALSHELTNTLAPMSSLLSSVHLMIGRPEHEARLEGALKALGSRVSHLSAFLTEYAAFAKLPRPRPDDVDWSEFVDGLAPLATFALEGRLPSNPGWFDRGQIEQVVLNLLKNAEEAGGPAEGIVLGIVAHDAGVLLTVQDRGQGLSDEVVNQAVLPFFSTKEDGTGLGLALSRDIVGAHGGWLSLSRREGGGASARVWLPDRD